MNTFAIAARRFAFALAAVSTACGSPPDEAADTANDVAALRFLPRYQGGPMLRNVEIAAVFWNSNVDANLVQFYTTLTSHQYLQRLAEYSTATQTIGLGSVPSAFHITPVNQSAGLSSPAVLGELVSQINAGHLPQPNANTLYALHFPPGVTIDGCPAGGCCSDHRSDSATISGAQVRLQYTRVLDFAPTDCCAENRDCQGNAAFQNLTATASHEVAEAVTDPQPPPHDQGSIPAWVADDLQTEIADDECTNTFGTITSSDHATFTIQSYYSFLAGRCIVPCSTATCTASGGCTPGSGCTLRDQNASFVDTASIFASPAANHGWIAPCAMDAWSKSFCPGASITRGELATVIIRALFGDWFSYTQAPHFVDVLTTDWRFPYVQKLRDLGFTSGTSANTYSPDIPATRRDAAVFVTRALAWQSGTPESFPPCPNPFFPDDVPPSDAAFRYIQELRRLGITRGTGATTYSPDLAISRESVAVFVETAFDPAHINDRSPASCP